jgi:hypothetical protein
MTEITVKANEIPNRAFLAPDILGTSFRGSEFQMQGGSLPMSYVEEIASFWLWSASERTNPEPLR